MVDPDGASAPGDTSFPVIVLEFGAPVTGLLTGEAQPATSAAIVHAAVIVGQPARLIRTPNDSNPELDIETRRYDSKFPDTQAASATVDHFVHWRARATIDWSTVPVPAIETRRIEARLEPILSHLALLGSHPALDR